MVQTKLPSVYDEVFTLTPSPLRAVCMDTISNELPRLTSSEVVFSSETKFETKSSFSQDIHIPDKIAESLIEGISRKGLISDVTLSLFSDISKYNLKSLRLPNINMTTSGQSLMKFKHYSFNEIILGCNIADNRWSMTKLIESFAASRFSLTTLKIDLYPAIKIASGSPFDVFVQFPNLQHLEYKTPITDNSTLFAKDDWEVLLTTCSSLRTIHFYINGPYGDLKLESKYFLECDKLESLTLYSALKSKTAITSFECIKHFLDLQNLRELDLSIDLDPPEINLVDLNLYEQNLETPPEKLAKYIDQFLELSVGKLPNLESLDLSALYKIKDSSVEGFVATHTGLCFLGLCMLQSKFCVNGDFAAHYSKLKVCFLLLC